MWINVLPFLRKVNPNPPLGNFGLFRLPGLQEDRFPQYIYPETAYRTNNRGILCKVIVW